MVNADAVAAAQLAQQDAEAAVLADRSMRAEAKARRAEQMGDKNPEFDWLRRDASELQWRERMKRDWAADDHKRLDALLVDRGVVSEGEDECAPAHHARSTRNHVQALAHTHALPLISTRPRSP